MQHSRKAAFRYCYYPKQLQELHTLQVQQDAPRLRHSVCIAHACRAADDESGRPQNAEVCDHRHRHTRHLANVVYYLLPLHHEEHPHLHPQCKASDQQHVNDQMGGLLDAEAGGYEQRTRAPPCPCRPCHRNRHPHLRGTTQSAWSGP